MTTPVQIKEISMHLDKLDRELDVLARLIKLVALMDTNVTSDLKKLMVKRRNKIKILTENRRKLL